jgi:hypothetical protein
VPHYSSPATYSPYKSRHTTTDPTVNTRGLKVKIKHTSFKSLRISSSSTSRSTTGPLPAVNKNPILPSKKSSSASRLRALSLNASTNLSTPPTSAKVPGPSGLSKSALARHRCASLRTRASLMENELYVRTLNPCH